jgi:hypothetical protein
MGDMPFTDLPDRDPQELQRPLHCPECLTGIGTAVNIAKGVKLVVITAVCEACAHKWTVQRHND